MGQKGHIMDQKGLKKLEKRQKIEFSNLKYLLFSGMGGYPPPSLRENHPAQKLLGKGVVCDRFLKAEEHIGSFFIATFKH